MTNFVKSFFQFWVTNWQQATFSIFVAASQDLISHEIPGYEVLKPFPCIAQLRTKFILLINVKMPTIVGILTFISMINTTSERLEARDFFICRYFTFYEWLKFRAQLS